MGVSVNTAVDNILHKEKHVKSYFPHGVYRTPGRPQRGEKKPLVSVSLLFRAQEGIRGMSSNPQSAIRNRKSFSCFPGKIVYIVTCFWRGVAQSGSAPAWGAGGRWFKSSHPDQIKQNRSLRLCRRLFLWEQPHYPLEQTA